MSDYSLSLDHWLVTPIVSVAVYRATQPLIRQSVAKPWPRRLFVPIALVHNLALMAFSVWTFFGCLKEMQQHPDLIFSSMDFFPKIRFWVYVFYLSKYWEFVDTLLLIVKHKEVSFLQSYHHCGAVIAMAVLFHTEANGAWIFVLFNSFVHSIMYLFYSCSVLGIRVPCKFVITQLQIIQFLVGLVCGCAYHLQPHIYTFTERMGLLFAQSYVLVLVFLFANFYRQAYTIQPSNSSSGPTKKSD